MHRLFRRLADTAFRAARELESSLKGKKLLKKLVYWPVIRREADLADALNRANWYFPEKGLSKASINFLVSPELARRVKDFILLRAPASQENYIGKNKRISITALADSEARETLSKADAILIWKASALFSVPFWPINLDRAWIVDKDYFLVTEARNYIWLYNETVPREKLVALLEKAKDNFSSFLSKARKKKKAYVFGTGPSVSNAATFDFSDGFSIVTNTMINDAKLMRHIKPIAIVHGDFVYHMGPSVYAAKFREQLFSKHGKELFSLIRFDILPFLVSRYPGLEGRFVAFPMRLFAGPNIPGKENYFLNLSNNSLVGYMLPVSCAAVDEVSVLGCDGRKPDDKLFWRHAKTVFYDGLQKTLVETHPSVYRDTDFSVYYNETIDDVEVFVEYAESRGKKFACLTPSYIPALHKMEKQ